MHTLVGYAYNKRRQKHAAKVNERTNEWMNEWNKQTLSLTNKSPDHFALHEKFIVYRLVPVQWRQPPVFYNFPETHLNIYN